MQLQALLYPFLQTSSQAHVGRAGRPGQVSQSSLITGSQLQKMGLVVPSRCYEQVWLLRVRMDMGLELWIVF